MMYRSKRLRPGDQFTGGFTAEQLAAQLDEMGLPRGARLMVHSSLRAAGSVRGGACAIIDALCGHLEGGLLVLPSYTFATIDDSHKDYDPYTEPSCSGILAEALLCRMPGAVRSLHPEYSVAVYGNGAEDLIEGELFALTPFPRTGCMGRLLDADGYVLLCGVGLDKCAFMYCAEEWMGTEDRLSAPATRYIADYSGGMHMTEVSRYECSKGDISKYYNKLRQPLIDMGAAKECRFAGADCLLLRCAPLISIATGVLLRRPDAFENGSPLPKRLLEKVKNDQRRKP